MILRAMPGGNWLLISMLAASLGVACTASATQAPAPATTPTPAATTPAPTLAATFAALLASPTQTTRPSSSVVLVGNASFTVELADTPAQRKQGLSGRMALPRGAGMLFVFEGELRHTFWMRDMEIALDFVWINADCVAVDLTEDVPPPEPGAELSDLPRYQPAVPVQYALEINAGEIAAAGIVKWDAVVFEGSLKGMYGC